MRPRRLLIAPLLFGCAAYSQAQQKPLRPGELALPAQDSSFAQWRAMADGGRGAAAESEARTYLAARPDSADGHFTLGYVLFRERRARESLAEYTEGAKFRQPSAQDLQVVASDYVLLGDYPDADKWFSKALEWDPGNLTLTYFLARTKYKENRFDEAVSLFERCVRADSHNVKGWDNLGLSQQGLGKIAEAEKDYRQAIRLQSEGEAADAGPYLNLGSLLVDTERSAEAIPLLQQTLRIDKSEVRAHRQLGKAYLHLNRLGEAEAELEASVREAPDHAATHFVLSQVYRRQGKNEKAREEAATYSRLTGNHSSASDDPK